MTLISVEGWGTMLWAITDEQENMWFQPSPLEAPALLHTYTLKELLEDWKPIRRH